MTMCCTHIYPNLSDPEVFCPLEIIIHIILNHADTTNSEKNYVKTETDLQLQRFF
ncbi:protein of unknown function [Candidatus Nitrosocosmicus franklandus]|uniref:Uncharacterized protein n=1 Tax=Candidatus Nitrosocosmicus franklandianus TaxID=1798806 RepID=A0A484I9J7_9ARCH|nr:protein of unknown function [Candidatus Nitrosocosmicus franklandus]